MQIAQGSSLTTIAKRKRLAQRSVSVAPRKKPWYEKPIVKEDFTISIGNDGNAYARHNEWKSSIWIGPYTSIDELNSVISNYIGESARSRLHRNISSKLHSVIIEDKSFFKS